jgi:hypothetical protein
MNCDGYDRNRSRTLTVHCTAIRLKGFSLSQNILITNRFRNSKPNEIFVHQMEMPASTASLHGRKVELEAEFDIMDDVTFPLIV